MRPKKPAFERARVFAFLAPVSDVSTAATAASLQPTRDTDSGGLFFFRSLNMRKLYARFVLWLIRPALRLADQPVADLRVELSEMRRAVHSTVGDPYR